MYSSKANVVTRANGTKRNQRGFFDAGIGLALLALFSIATSAIVSNEADKAERQLASCASATSGGGQPAVACEDRG